MAKKILLGTSASNLCPANLPQTTPCFCFSEFDGLTGGLPSVASDTDSGCWVWGLGLVRSRSTGTERERLVHFSELCEFDAR